MDEIGSGVVQKGQVDDMANAVRVTGLTKRYDDFTLDHVSFDVPRGCIVGLIGENGAGKSTVIKAILGMINRDDGEVFVFDREDMSPQDKEQVGVVFDDKGYPEMLSPRQIGRVLKGIYSGWDAGEYGRFLKEFSLPEDKKLKNFSKGMRMKLAIAAALSHRPELLILDEATSGLDPVMRDDILDILLDFMQEEEHSILVSSHITSDLEKVADYIVFIHQGQVVFAKPKDELLMQYGIIKCGAAQFDQLDKGEIISWRKQDYEWQALVSDRALAMRRYPKAVVTPATIDEIMLMYVKGER